MILKRLIATFLLLIFSSVLVHHFLPHHHDDDRHEHVHHHHYDHESQSLSHSHQTTGEDQLPGHSSRDLIFFLVAGYQLQSFPYNSEVNLSKFPAVAMIEQSDFSIYLKTGMAANPPPSDDLISDIYSAAIPLRAPPANIS